MSEPADPNPGGRLLAVADRLRAAFEGGASVATINRFVHDSADQFAGAECAISFR